VLTKESARGLLRVRYEEVNMDDVRYPVGKFDRRDRLTPGERSAMIEAVAEAPARMRDAVRSLDAAKLDAPYREGGWTVRQVVHHVPDSHMNAYLRFKWALTEERPTIKPYDEAEWAKLSDSQDTPVETSLTMLEALHDRWVRLMRKMTDADFKRVLLHPEHAGEMTLDSMLGLYEWHGRHHVGHVTALRKRSGW
jgi:uncharacterized damage-inducible protein DinB